MKVVLQRVTEAAVRVDGQIVGQIGRGFVALIGIKETDTPAIADKMAEKISKLRIFGDENGKTNLCAADVNGEILVVSQFTLYADCRKGNRPSFTNAAPQAQAEELYEHFADTCEPLFARTDRGQFGADMQVSLTNDGPFTITLDSDELTP